MNNTATPPKMEVTELPTAVQQRIMDFCCEMAIALRQITGRVGLPDASDLPTPVAQSRKKDHGQ